LLQQTRETGDWEPWILYMLRGVELTARQTIWIIGGIKALMMDYKHRIRAELPKLYSQDLLNNLFRHPYTKIDALQADLGVSRLTASKYLDRLSDAGFVEKRRIGRYNYYVNVPLMGLFAQIPDRPGALDMRSIDAG
jgi:Fic family protein